MQIKSGLYRHYKGNLYQVIGVARHTETSDYLVVYQALYDDKDLFVRPIKMFTEFVEYEEKIIPRFQFLNKNV